jgi:hypothetical protein
MNGFIHGAAYDMPDDLTASLSEVERPCFQEHIDSDGFTSNKKSAMDELSKTDKDYVVATNYLTLMGLALFNYDCTETRDYVSYVKDMRSNLKNLNEIITQNKL